MKLTLERQDHRSDGIFSFLKDEKRNIIAKCLEHAYQGYIKTEADVYLPKPGVFLPKLYVGTFTCVLGTHNLGHGPFQTYEITGVTGHTGILFHVGNWNKDSNGCVLVGEGIAHSDTGQMITNSRATFKNFLDLLDNRPTFLIEVR